jgi:hypothetical protein
MSCRMLALAILASGASLAAPAALAAKSEFPVLGVFGVASEQGCESAKKEEEGSYVAFEKGLKTGEGGAGGCDYVKIESLPKSEYRLTGECYALEGPRKKTRASLIVPSPNEVTYNGAKYTKCK